MLDGLGQLSRSRRGWTPPGYVRRSRRHLVLPLRERACVLEALERLVHLALVDDDGTPEEGPLFPSTLGVLLERLLVGLASLRVVALEDVVVADAGVGVDKAGVLLEAFWYSAMDSSEPVFISSSAYQS